MFTTTALGQHYFMGPYLSTSQLHQQAGVYIITTLTKDGRHKVLDVGQSHNVHARISNHDRAPQWKLFEERGLFASVHYCEAALLDSLEKAVRIAYSPVCGVR